MGRLPGSLSCIETSVRCDDCLYTSNPEELCKVLGLAMLRDNLLLRVEELTTAELAKKYDIHPTMIVSGVLPPPSC